MTRQELKSLIESGQLVMIGREELCFDQGIQGPRFNRKKSCWVSPIGATQLTKNGKWYYFRSLPVEMQPDNEKGMGDYIEYVEEIDKRGKTRKFVIPNGVIYEGPFDTEEEALNLLYDHIKDSDSYIESLLRLKELTK